MKSVFRLGIIMICVMQITAGLSRKPSLRLRYGRSVSPDDYQPLQSQQQQQQQQQQEQYQPLGAAKRWLSEINQKPIRSPSLRLRFGKRDPFSQNNEMESSIDDVNLNDAEYLYQRMIRRPTTRLRWGRSGKIMDKPTDEDFYRYFQYLLDKLTIEDDSIFLDKLRSIRKQYDQQNLSGY